MCVSNSMHEPKYNTRESQPRTTHKMQNMIGAFCRLLVPAWWHAAAAPTATAAADECLQIAKNRMCVT